MGRRKNPAGGKYKTGRLGEDEQKFIAANATTKPEQIALTLNRRTETIEAYLKKHTFSPESAALDQDLAYDIESRSFWSSLKKQFNAGELEMFKADWARTIKQFGSDVTHTEEKQIVQSCSITIMMYRTLEEVYKSKAKLDKLENIYGAELAKQNKDRDKDLLIQLDNQISSMRVATTSLTSTYDKLFRDQQVLQKDLKATRDQRIDKLQQTQTTFFEWLKWLQSENNLQAESYEMELRRVAMWKNFVLTGAQLHAFEDDNLDQPVLNSETIELIPKEQDTQRRVQNIIKEAGEDV